MGISLILNIYTLILFKRKNNIVIQKNNKKYSENKIKMERRLTVYVLVTFLGQLIVSLFMVTWFTASAALKPFVDKDTYNLINFAVQNQSEFSVIIWLCKQERSVNHNFAEGFVSKEDFWGFLLLGTFSSSNSVFTYFHLGI
ncbi:unnamed protein product [Meloidogyne enterolobii]|uniref:Uncharacterized protein n=1 Tax=Meloidogyne enterolobii TaxID=390850 RepID=A0ACB1ACE3_MELEN